MSAASWWVFKIRVRYYLAFTRTVLKENILSLTFRRVYQFAAGK